MVVCRVDRIANFANSEALKIAESSESQGTEIAEIEK